MQAGGGTNDCLFHEVLVYSTVAQSEHDSDEIHRAVTARQPLGRYFSGRNVRCKPKISALSSLSLMRRTSGFTTTPKCSEALP
jgi:hypothetical protein